MPDKTCFICINDKLNKERNNDRAIPHDMLLNEGLLYGDVTAWIAWWYGPYIYTKHCNEKLKPKPRLNFLSNLHDKFKFFSSNKFSFLQNMKSKFCRAGTFVTTCPLWMWWMGGSDLLFWLSGWGSRSPANVFLLTNAYRSASLYLHSEATEQREVTAC